MPAAPLSPAPDSGRPRSALSGALARIGDRWSLLLVEALMSGALRFADLEHAIPDISTNILSARLRHLEAERVVLAVPYSQRPRRYSYELTDAGRELAGAVRMLAQWSADHGGPPAGAGPDGGAAGSWNTGAPLHGACGTPLVAIWWCPTCEQPAGSDGPDAVWV